MDKTKPQKQPPDTNRPVLVLTPGGRIIVCMYDDGEWLMENAWGQDADWMEMVVDPVDWTEMPSWDGLRMIDVYDEERNAWEGQIADLIEERTKLVTRVAALETGVTTVGGQRDPKEWAESLAKGYDTDEYGRMRLDAFASLIREAQEDGARAERLRKWTLAEDLQAQVAALTEGVEKAAREANGFREAVEHVDVGIKARVVAALEEAGYRGQGYKIASEKLYLPSVSFRFSTKGTADGCWIQPR